MSFNERIPGYVDRVEAALDRWLPKSELRYGRLHAAMRYSVLGGGKRIRPLLVYAAGELLGLAPQRLDAPACAVELIHAYSLVHDDLPAMDDDALRRGRPTTHRAYDEATAILVGDALLALAFTILSEEPSMAASARARARMIGELARACGPDGLTGGQIIDLNAEGRRLDRADLEDMYERKTAVLIRAAVMLACHAAGRLEAAQLERLARYARAIGIAFQIRDDILDVEGATVIIGKQQGADVARGKATFPGLFGLEAARGRIGELFDEAMAELEAFGETAESLRAVSRYIVDRDV